MLTVGVLLAAIGPGSPQGRADTAALSPAAAAELAAATERLSELESELDSLATRQAAATGDRSNTAAERDGITVSLAQLENTRTALGDQAASLVTAAADLDRQATQQRAAAVSEARRAGALRDVVEGFAAELYVGRASDPSVLAAVLDQLDNEHPTTPRPLRAKIYGADAAQSIAADAAAHLEAANDAHHAAKNSTAAASQARADADTARAQLDQTEQQRIDLQARHAALDRRTSELDTELADTKTAIAALETERADTVERIRQLRTAPAINTDAVLPQPAPSTAAIDIAAMAGPPTGIDPALYQALVAAEAGAAVERPACGVDWAVLAAIAETESALARYGGATIAPDGTVAPAILGIRLDGSVPGTETIPDTDRGALDGDPLYDRAVGPFQFIPSSWALFARDANRDGRADPHNVYDAAAAAAEHLCRPGWQFSDPDQAARAVYGYNPSWTYVSTILERAAVWRATIAPPPRQPNPSRATTTTVPPQPPVPPPPPPGPGTAVGPFALPVDRAVIDTDPTVLDRPHHDYPAWDLPLPVGSPLYALTGGTVTGTTADRRCGTGLVVAATNGWTYTYCHATTLNVTTGAVLAAGQQVAVSGNTGNSTGPHLHLQITDPAGVLVCPQPLLAALYTNQPPPIPLPTTGCIETETGQQRATQPLDPATSETARTPATGTTTSGSPARTPAPSTAATATTRPAAAGPTESPAGGPTRPARRPADRLEPPVVVAAHPPGASAVSAPQGGVVVSPPDGSAGLVGARIPGPATLQRTR